jgi:hypothetical protein
MSVASWHLVCEALTVHCWHAQTTSPEKFALGLLHGQWFADAPCCYAAAGGKADNCEIYAAGN